MGNSAAPRLSVITNSDIVSLAEIEDAHFEGDFAMSTAREEMREGFIRLEMGLAAVEKRIEAIEKREEEAKKALALAHDERTGRLAERRLIARLIAGAAAVIGAAWAAFTHFFEK